MADEADPIEENKNSSTTPNPLQGLADDLEDVAAIRKYCLKNKALLSWLSAQKVGVISNKSLKMNARPGDRFTEVVPGGPRSENCSRELLEKTGRVQQSLQQLCNVQKLSFGGIFCND